MVSVEKLPPPLRNRTCGVSRTLVTVAQLWGPDSFQVVSVGWATWKTRSANSSKRSVAFGSSASSW